MKLEHVTWNIVGVRPLMQSNPAVMQRNEGDASTIGTSKRNKKQKPAYDEAKDQLYIDEDGHFYHPAIAFWRGLFVAAPNRTFGSTAASTVVSQAVATVEENFILLDPNTLKSKRPKPLTDKDWVHDVRRAVNKKAGGILVSRPKWREWGGLLTFEVDREMLGELKAFTDLLNIAGRYGVGVGRMKRGEGASGSWGGMNLGKFSAELR